ncbi:MAG TPA: C4-type zinc ribbon domain-containing protein [Thermoanaerobaculales bacterium]|nr:C4-type zinc ribbon domain-containing protein [Thermoanaerobaculales bacterium]HPA80835.1 C4-type zinc ribbon domain-containing protein [Thermoanaerobaculales bacterium]HQL29872.1 C4-type zinc ribbon domain-containing protein [Thermoanaerobaculales bacterium]HQN96709.1 C4-type zinc ribbon domain-containing protein [Thermoanaerobaculales bacterium]HQP44580.1 C4-type zinc ribbon domain-containing protein [Thermoanaerobaculales bacterium]
MESIQKDLGVLVRLQDVYGRIARAIQDRQCPPPEVQQLQEANRDRQHELDQLEDQVRRVEDELEQVHKREEEWQLELEHFQRQKGTVTNEREFTAVISEIDYASKALNEARQRRAELEESVEQLRQDIGSRRQARPEEESAQREVVEGWERRKFELLGVVHRLSAEAERLEAELQPKIRARFLRLLKSKKGTAVAAVVEGSCSVCHFAVRPHLRQRLRRCEEIITCESCFRILYLEEAIDRESAGPSSG